MTKRIRSGINSPGGKDRALKGILKRIPFREYYLEPFLGSGIVGLNSPRARYEVFNDKYYEIYNYFRIITRYPKEFDNFKKGVFGLVSEQLWKDIRDRKIRPRNNIERAYFFYYMNKLTRSGRNQNQLKNKDVVPDVKKQTKTNSFKGIRVNNTRPYTNNDNGLLTPIDPRVIERLQFVTLTCKDFRTAYLKFHKKYHIERGLSSDVFIYFDPPFPKKEDPYYHKFIHQDHLDLIEILLDCPFKFMLSIAGECNFYLDTLKEAGNYIEEILVKYSTNAKHQHETIEYLIMNYNYKKVPRPIEFVPESNQLNLTQFIEA